MSNLTELLNMPYYPGHTEDCPVLQGVQICDCGATLATALMIVAEREAAPRQQDQLLPARLELCTES
jgi:hypothetical protein